MGGYLKKQYKAQFVNVYLQFKSWHIWLVPFKIHPIWQMEPQG